MLCDKCKKNEANVHVSQYVNGVMYEQNLCGECAGMQSGMFAGIGGFSGFGNMFDQLRQMSMIGAPVGAAAAEIPRVGGREESIFEELGLKLPDFNERPEEEPVVKEEKETLEGLKMQLEEAVKAQEFEKAAELRDKIYFMEKEEKGE